MKRIYLHRTLFPLLGLLLILPTSAFAQETLPDKFKINVGAFFVTDISTDVTIAKTGEAISAGVGIDFEDQLGLENRDTVPRIDGYYRFGKKSRVDFSYWKLDRDSTFTINENISIGDINIGVNETVFTRFDTETLKASYGFSFYNVPKAELGLSAGLHITNIAIKVADLSGGAGSEEVEGPVPLPVFGFYLRYNISHRWRFVGHSEWFFIDYDEFEGSLTDVRLSVEHQTFKHAGFGFGFNRIEYDLEVDDTSEDLRGSFNNTNSGFQAYVFAAFGKAKYQE